MTETDFDRVARIRNDFPVWGPAKILSALGLPGFKFHEARRYLAAWDVLVTFDSTLTVHSVVRNGIEAQRARFAMEEAARNRPPMTPGTWGVIERARRDRFTWRPEDVTEV